MKTRCRKEQEMLCGVYASHTVSLFYEYKWHGSSAQGTAVVSWPHKPCGSKMGGRGAGGGEGGVVACD